MLKVRAGILRDISPSREQTLAPSLPDANSWAYTVGLGYAVNRDLEINAAYFHDTQDTTISTRPEFPGAFDTRANIWSLAVVWRFGGTPQ
jgi:long-subunit fatty acid transport protein